MILVDTSVWIDHLHAANAELAARLEADEVGQHPLVVEELALGSIRHRQQVLELISNLTRFPTLTHAELLDLIELRRLWGLGLSAIDAHLLGSVLIAGGELWTRDRRLRAAAASAGLAIVP